jgi:site-specific DNA recombinase
MAVHRLRHDAVEHAQPIRVIAYARVNGQPANQARALALQSERMRQFVLDHAGWTLVGEFSDMTAGRSDVRLPGLRDAVAEAVADGCDVFLVDSFDRVSRLMCGFLAVVEELNRAGVRLWSATEPFNSGTPSGRFALKVLTAIAEYERVHNRRERAARARGGRG